MLTVEADGYLEIDPNVTSCDGYAPDPAQHLVVSTDSNAVPPRIRLNFTLGPSHSLTENEQGVTFFQIFALHEASFENIWNDSVGDDDILAWQRVPYEDYQPGLVYFSNTELLELGMHG